MMPLVKNAIPKCLKCRLFMTDKVDSNQENPAQDNADPTETKPSNQTNSPRPKEIGGRKGPDPTRYGDWEKNGRCIDF